MNADLSAVSHQPARGRGGATRPLPLLTLPKRDPILEITAQKAFRVAGCHICTHPIAKGDARLRIVLQLPEARVTRGRERNAETYYVHAQCVLDGLSGLDRRPANSCWECGQAVDGFAEACFTTSQFAFGQLCDDCAKAPRWTACQHCGVNFPHWMVSYTRDDMLFCDGCSMRTGNETRRIVEQKKKEFEDFRQELLEHGPFG